MYCIVLYWHITTVCVHSHITMIPHMFYPRFVFIVTSPPSHLTYPRFVFITTTPPDLSKVCVHSSPPSHLTYPRFVLITTIPPDLSKVCVHHCHPTWLIQGLCSSLPSHLTYPRFVFITTILCGTKCGQFKHHIGDCWTWLISFTQWQNAGNVNPNNT